MKAIGYFIEGAKHGGATRSIGEQNRAFMDFCARNGYEVAATFLDTEGQDAQESGFNQMMSYLRRGDRGFIIVVVDCLGALGPDLGHAAMRLLTIEETGVQVFSAHNDEEAARSLVEAWAGRGDGTPVSERVRTAMRRKAVRGEALGRPPYGYRVGPKRRLEIVPEEAAVVRYIFRLYLTEGLGIRLIAGRLNEESIPTRRGGRWSMVSIRDILRNRTYLGTYSRFGVKVPDSHPALVTAQDFRLVQERLQARQSSGGKRTVQPFLLSGLAYCGRCGNHMIGVSRKQNWKTRDGEARSASYRYYQCETRTNQNACDYNTQRAPDLEQRVRDQLEHGANAPARIQRAGNVDTYIQDSMAQVERLEGQIRRVRRQVEELVADTAHGHLSIERLRALGAEAAREQQGLQRELEAARERLAGQRTVVEQRQHLEELRERVVREWDAMDFAGLQVVLRELIDRLDVDGEDLRLSLRG
ncbi:MAG: recombinase family protein [Dehalococcoidia bacterium]|nr:recombinase family protein [Dehalococcoidia bacterium]